MKNYDLKIENDNHYIIEVATDQIIKSFKKFNDARKFLKKMNNGCGFCGFTPNFILRDMTSYINKERK